MVFVFLFLSLIPATGSQIPSFVTSVELARTYTPHGQILIEGNEEFVATALEEGWEGFGTVDDPYIISGYRISGVIVGQPLIIWDTDVYFIVDNNIIEGAPGAFCGMSIGNASNGVLSNNIIHDRHHGIVIMGVSNFDITNNIIYHLWGSGIWITDGLEHVTISNNTIYDVDKDGIQLSSLVFSSRIEYNNISDCGWNGIDIFGSQNCIVADNIVNNCQGAGIAAAYGMQDVFRENTITEIHETGINLVGTSFGAINRNNISSGDSYALELDASSSNNTISQNAFAQNGQDCQVSDSGLYNEFSFNHYSDWINPDVNCDNIVDIPYAIAGETGNADDYAISNPEYGFTSTPTRTSTQSTTENYNPNVPLEFVIPVAVIPILIFTMIFFIRLKNR